MRAACLQTVIDKLADNHINLSLNDQEWSPYNLRACISHMLPTDEIRGEALSWISPRTDFTVIARKWFDRGIIPAIDNPMYTLLGRYWHEDWRSVIWTYLRNSNLLVYRRLLSDGVPVYTTDECMYPFDYMPQETLKRVATMLCFQVKTDYILGVSGDYKDWMSSIAKTGAFSFKPYVYSGLNIALPVKYNKVLRCVGNRIVLCSGESVLVSSGVLPSLNEMHESSCEYVLFMAALSVAIYVSDFYKVENMKMLSDYCIGVFEAAGIAVSSVDLYSDALRCFTCIESSVTHGHRITKTYAWDFVRWFDTPRGYTVEVPAKDGCETYLVSFGATSMSECIQKMLHSSAPSNFKLITGVMAMLGIYLDSSRAWPVDTKLCMPAYNTDSFDIVEHL